MQWATENGCPWNENVLATAARKGYLDVLQWALAAGFPWGTNIWNMICKEAVRQRSEFRCDKWIEGRAGCVYRKSHIIQHFHIIKWAKDNGFDSWKSYITKHVIFDDMNTLRTILDLFNTGENPCYPFDASDIAKAAKDGNLSCIQWLKDIGCDWDEEACFAAALGGHLHVLQWLYSQDCPWDGLTILGAAKGGHLPIIEWARANGCPWNEDASSEAAAHGHLEILRWLRSHGCPWDSSVCKLAALHGHLHVLQWADKNGQPWNDGYCKYAAQGGQFHIVKWACDNGFQNWKQLIHKYVKFNRLKHLQRIQDLFQLGGNSSCIWDEQDMAKAARSNDLSIIQWLRNQGCAWDERTFAAAVGRCGSYTLEWIQQNGCPWDESACFQAVRADNIWNLQWLRSHGCPWNEVDCANIAILNGHSQVLDWMKANGFLNIDGDDPIGEADAADKEIIAKKNNFDEDR